MPSWSPNRFKRHLLATSKASIETHVHGLVLPGSAQDPGTGDQDPGPVREYFGRSCGQLPCSAQDGATG